MNSKQFQEQLNSSRIRFAIQEAERKTSGEIRILISNKKVQNPLEAAQKVFRREKMDRTRERNAVLLYIAPLSQTYAVIGDVGIQEKVGSLFWDGVVCSMGIHFKNELFTAGIVEALDLLGTALAAHFPRRSDDQNELSDQILWK